MTFHTFNFEVQEILRKIPFLLFSLQNVQSLLYTASFCNFITPMNHLEFCDRNITPLYPPVIILTSSFKLWITSFTAIVDPLYVMVFPISQIYFRCNFTDVAWNFICWPIKRNPKKSNYVLRLRCHLLLLGKPVQI